MPQFPPRGVFYDGDVTVASPSGGLETSTPFPWQPSTLIFSQKFQQHRDYWTPLAQGANPIDSGMNPPAPFSNNPKTGRGPFLVEETDRQDVGGGVWEWTRKWAHVPYVNYEYPAMNYQRQNYAVSTIPWSGVIDQWGNFHGNFRTFTAVEEWCEPLTATIETKFIYIPSTKYNPKTILKMCKPLLPYRIVRFNDERGREHVFQLGTRGVAEGTQISTWMGDILQVRNVYVSPSPMSGSSSSGVPIGPGLTSNLPAWPYLNDLWQPIYL